MNWYRRTSWRRSVKGSIVLTSLTLFLVSSAAALTGQETKDNAPPRQGTVSQGESDQNDAVKATVVKILQTQSDAWNRGDIDGFMETYWNSPELTFSSGGSTTRGWQATLDRYKQRYSTAELMGQLTFDDIEFQLLSEQVALVLGKWQLKRDSDEPEGNFSLVLRMIDGNWRIVHDHSSTLEK